MTGFVVHHKSESRNLSQIGPDHVSPLKNKYYTYIYVLFQCEIDYLGLQGSARGSMERFGEKQCKK